MSSKTVSVSLIDTGSPMPGSKHIGVGSVETPSVRPLNVLIMSKFTPEKSLLNVAWHGM